MSRLAFFKVHKSAYIPQYATEGSACFDFKASLITGNEVTYYDWMNNKQTSEVLKGVLYVKPGCRYLVPTNLIMDIPDGFSVRIHPRSGLALKQGITLVNCEGVIDSDYVDPTYITLLNMSDTEVAISDGDRIAQGELVFVESTEIVQALDAPKQKSSRQGGFGSTGV